MRTIVPAVLAVPAVERLAYTIPDACQCLSCGRTHLYQLFQDAELVPIKSGGKTLVPTSELRGYIARKLAAAKAAAEGVRHARAEN